jgi:hypothetical protein
MSDRITRNQLAHINSMTKYPAIPTYHTLNTTNGMLSEPVVQFTGQVIGSEKVDGTNGRMIIFPNGQWLVGSREELMHAQGDLVINPDLGIVNALHDLAEHVATHPHDTVTAYYLEVYGGGIGQSWKQYASTRDQAGYRLFDVVTLDGYDDMLTWPRERIASWRDHGGQRFVSEKELWEVAGSLALDVAPRLFDLLAEDLPTGIAETRAFLAEHMPATRVALDSATPGRPEGIVLRTADRSVIAKARFEDYDKTLRKLANKR